VADFYLTIRYPLKNYLVAGDDFSEREGCHLILTDIQGQSWHDDKFDHFWQHSTEGKIGLPSPRWAKGKPNGWWCRWRRCLGLITTS